jgi:hypothetical protein
MGGIAEAHVEWAVINRLKAMLDDPPQTDFNVTLAFSLFSTILIWTKNRMWIRDAEIPADEYALAARKKLGETMIVDAPWSLSRAFPDRQGNGEANADFVEMPAWDFFKWLRDALAHGDGRTIRPLHWTSHATGKEWLGGFRVEFSRANGYVEILTLHLFKRDIQNLGQQLADLFCQHLAEGDGYHFSDEATKRLLEPAINLAFCDLQDYIGVPQEPPPCPPHS